MSPPPKPTITLFAGPEVRNTYSPSPFVTKLEARFRFSSLSYTRTQGSFLQAPMGKIPYVALSSLSSAGKREGKGKEEEKGEGEVLGDSTLIIRRLIDGRALADLNEGLDAVAKAQDLALKALLEDRVYFYQNHERWLQNFHTMRDSLFANMTYPLRLAVGLFAYRANSSALWGQGTSRFSPSEVSAFHREAWGAVEDVLAAARDRKARERGERSREESEPFWILGDSGPSEADATVFGFVVSEMVCAGSPEGRKVIRGMPALMSYARQIHARYFPDYEAWD